MQSTTSFLGKCVTVLIGMGLSWLTVTNPQAEQFASQVFGTLGSNINETASREPELDTELSRPVKSPPLHTTVEAHEHSGSLDNTGSLLATSEFAIPQLLQVNAPALAGNDEQRLQELSLMLKELGATYLRVEKLAKSGDTCFRVRCDLARNSEQVKCCLESTRGTAIAAMEDVLQAARYGMERSNDQPAAG